MVTCASTFDSDTGASPYVSASNFPGCGIRNMCANSGIGDVLSPHIRRYISLWVGYAFHVRAIFRWFHLDAMSCSHHLWDEFVIVHRSDEIPIVFVLDEKF